MKADSWGQEKGLGRFQEDGLSNFTKSGQLPQPMPVSCHIPLSDRKQDHAGTPFAGPKATNAGMA